MVEGTPPALSMRVSLALLGPALLLMAAMMLARPVDAQTPEGTVGIIPAISSVAAERGPFTVFVVLEDLEHYGTLFYDDDRDTVPDREVESIGLAAFEFTMEYDETVLALADVERGPALERTGRIFQCLPPKEEPGSLRFGCLSSGAEPPGPQGTLTLASVTLRPLGPGSSPLLLEANLAGPLGADEVPVAVSGGAVRVTGSAIATPTRASTAPSPAGDGPVDTPASVGPTEPPDTSQNGEVAGVPTAPPAPMDGLTPGAPTAPAAGDDGDGQGVTVRRDIEAESGRSAVSGGRSVSSVALWSAIALGGLVAAGALGLGAILWQRRKRRLGA